MATNTATEQGRRTADLPPPFVLRVSGTKPLANMQVQLVPLVFIRQPEYWGIDVVGSLHDQSAVTVHHWDGQDAMEIEECGKDLAPFAAVVGDRRNVVSESAAGEATGMSRHLSFDEAFADALAQLPPPASQHPDQLTSVVVVETGGLFGGFPISTSGSRPVPTDRRLER
jgi:hypothetical protein